MNKRTRKRCLAFFLIFFVLFGAVLALREPIMKRIYPLAYGECVESCSDEYDVPKQLLLAVIWCESRFRPDAESAAGACGLMQLTKTTFEEMLGRLDLPKSGDIFSPDLNIRCGTFYLHYLYKLYGNWETVLAAYNAGMGNVNEWLADPQYSDDGMTLKSIPFAETDNYVKKVLDTQEIYKDLYIEF